MWGQYYYCHIDIYYANKCYGISAASKFYFNKPVSELTLSQTAYICAIPNSPTYYDPVKDSTKALPRRDKILNDMFECGYITLDELNKALILLFLIFNTK